MTGKRRKKAIITDANSEVLIKELFRQSVPEGILVRANPRAITHYHSYGGLSQFFLGLAEGKLMGTQCLKCGQIPVWIPPRVHCPDCWAEMSWVVVQPYGAKVYSHSITNLPGAGFKGSVPCPLISVEIPGVCTKPMGYLLKFSKGEPYIGMPVKPYFRKKNPTYTILDLAWVPID